MAGLCWGLSIISMALHFLLTPHTEQDAGFPTRTQGSRSHLPEKQTFRVKHQRQDVRNAFALLNKFQLSWRLPGAPACPAALVPPPAASPPHAHMRDRPATLRVSS